MYKNITLKNANVHSEFKFGIKFIFYIFNIYNVWQFLLSFTRFYREEKDLIKTYS